jgi:hypothetical protein
MMTTGVVNRMRLEEERGLKNEDGEVGWDGG